MYVNLTGTIQKLNFGKNNNPTTFDLYSKNDKQKYECIMYFRYNIRYGDILSGTFTKSNNNYILQGLPAVIIPFNKFSICNDLKISLKFTNGEEKTIFEKMKQYTKSGSDEEIFNFISHISQSHESYGIIYDSFADMFGSFETSNELIKSFLYKWYKQKILRKLELLGFNKKKISEYWLNALSIYNKFVENPYSVPIISRDLKDKYISMYPKQYLFISDEMKFASEIYQAIYDKMMTSSWTGIPMHIIKKVYPDILKYNPILYENYGVIYDVKFETFYLDYPYKVETTITDLFIKFMKNNDLPHIDSVVEKSGSDYSLSPDQKNAILSCLNNKIAVITGGAGTGKSSTLTHLLYNLQINNIEYAVCSFTGIAVSRIRKLMGLNTTENENHWLSSYKNSPRTIHRLICDEKMRKSNRHVVDVLSPKVKCVVIDEASMVSSELLFKFLESYPGIERIILVGDCNQILPISWGNLFDQVILSSTIPVNYLTKNYRTSKGDSIIINANGILKHKGDNYNFITNENFAIYHNTSSFVVQLIEHLLKNGINYDDFIIISPMNRNVDTINKEIQMKINKNVNEYKDEKGDIWRVGDRIIITKNFMSLRLFNGDIGYIKQIYAKVDQKSIMEICVNGKSCIVEMTRAIEEDREDCESGITLNHLKLSYCITVNKSQGSEWKYVILYVPEFCAGTFLNRNLFYTAITRAKTCVWVVTSSISSFSKVCVQKGSSRYDNMKNRLRDNLEIIEAIKGEGDMESDIVDDGYYFEMSNDYDVDPIDWQ